MIVSRVRRDCHRAARRAEGLCGILPLSCTLPFLCTEAACYTISCCVFFIKPINTDPRFGLCVGGLFTAVGNKYITDSAVPATNAMTLIDYLHLITFLCIFLIVIQSVISLMIYEKDTDASRALSKKFDRLSFLFVVLLFSSTIIVLTLNAM